MKKCWQSWPRGKSQGFISARKMALEGYADYGLKTGPLEKTEGVSGSHRVKQVSLTLGQVQAESGFLESLGVCSSRTALAGMETVGVKPVGKS